MKWDNLCYSNGNAWKKIACYKGKRINRERFNLTISDCIQITITENNNDFLRTNLNEILHKNNLLTISLRNFQMF